MLAICFAGSWVTAELGFEWTQTHFYLGYASLGLVVFRLIWGFVGPEHARFSRFLAGPSRLLSHAKSLLSAQPSASVGHTPLGGWVSLLMILMVGIQAGSGLFLTDDIFYAGPYNPVVSGSMASDLAGLHHLNFDLLLILVILHLTAIAWYRLRKGQNLAGAMVTGRKAAPLDAQIESSRLGRALLIAAVVAGAVTALVLLAPPPAVVDYY